MHRCVVVSHTPQANIAMVQVPKDERQVHPRRRNHTSYNPSAGSTSETHNGQVASRHEFYLSFDKISRPSSTECDSPTANERRLGRRHKSPVGRRDRVRAGAWRKSPCPREAPVSSAPRVACTHRLCKLCCAGGSCRGRHPGRFCPHDFTEQRRTVPCFAHLPPR